MGVPRWFYGTLALCAVVTTAAVVYAQVFRPAWVLVSADGALSVVDTHTGTVCVETRAAIWGTVPPRCVTIPSAALGR
jgi:hypothetical protein